MSYTAPAVTFDGTQSISIGTLSCTDSTTFSMSFWFKRQTTDAVNSNYLFKVPSGRFRQSYIDGSTTLGDLLIGLYDSGETAGFEIELQLPVDSYWHNVVYSCDLSGATAVYALYIDGVQNTSFTINFNSGPCTIAFNGLAVDFGTDGTTLTQGSLSDFWFAPNVSLLSAGTIPSATLAKFIDGSGKPVDPTGFPTGGAVLFSGNATGFAVNQGTGGTATLTGTLANADFGPSDAPTGYNFTYFQGSFISNATQWADPNSNLLYILRQPYSQTGNELVTVNRQTGATVATQTYTAGDFGNSLGVMTGAYTESTYVYELDYSEISSSNFTNNYRKFNRVGLTLASSHVVTGETFSADQPMFITSDGTLIAQFIKTATSPPTNSWIVRIYRPSDNTIVDTDIEALLTTAAVNSQSVPLVWDSSNNLWLGGVNGTLYKIAVNSTTLALTLTTSYTGLASSLQIGNLTWYAPNGYLLIWSLDPATAAPNVTSAKILIWNPATETTVRGPYDWSPGAGFDTGDNHSGWQNTVFYASVLVDGSSNNDDFSVISINDGTQTSYAHSLWAVSNTLQTTYYNNVSPPTLFTAREGGGYTLALFSTPVTASSISTGACGFNKTRIWGSHEVII